MSVATSTAIAIGVAGVAAAGSVASSVIGSHAASKAGETQAQAANHAADIAHQDNTAALNYQKQKDALARSDLAPWRTAGTAAIGDLAAGVKSGTYDMAPFQAPTLSETNDPGYKFRLQLGQDAIEKSAAARGGLLTGGTARAEGQFAQDYASNEYGNVYDRAMREYGLKRDELTGKFNRTASIAGVGQTAANTTASLGQESARNISSIYANDAAQVGAAYQNAGAARASGYIGSANAINSGINGLTNSLMLYSMLNPPKAAPKYDDYL
jgi:hypothetical protein